MMETCPLDSGAAAVTAPFDCFLAMALMPPDGSEFCQRPSKYTGVHRHTYTDFKEFPKNSPYAY
jgi:hypothetical protein